MASSEMEHELRKQSEFLFESKAGGVVPFELSEPRDQPYERPIQPFEHF